MAEKIWKTLPLAQTQLNLQTTLFSGQAFRWYSLPSSNSYISVLQNTLLEIRHEQNLLHYKTHCSDLSDTNVELLIRDYFRLDTDLVALYEVWSTSSGVFKKKATDFPGIRSLRQDPVENLFTFICTQNNNISRITGMIEKLCEKYGKYIDTLDDKKYYAFPTIDSLCGDNIEQELRDLGFGYRAKYVAKTAKDLKEKGVDWLFSLRTQPYEDVKAELLKFHGIGPKVADCICLMSLDKLDVVPVDTHVRQIAIRDFNFPNLKNKTISADMYAKIGALFKDIFGKYAGWAHSVLFVADLSAFKDPAKRKNSDEESNLENDENEIVKKLKEKDDK
ncbi:8-oxoguanine glycosylase ogg1 [Nowakowskiella sp. JEL0407]|nr:8-oxoguanine glycosylase ogg1 [Nowakowskiella sp. JEL0407]